jgi:hypothetical protein
LRALRAPLDGALHLFGDGGKSGHGYSQLSSSHLKQ